MVLEAIHTPGHISDHISFLLKSGQEDILFCGDIILDSPSTVVDDLPIYMKTLYDLRKVKFDWLCTTHSLDLSEESGKDHIILPGHKKLEEYIEYRETRLNSLLKLVSD